MDDVAKYNVERWRALVEADALYTRPNLNLDAQSAREWVDAEGRLGDVSGREVLCLASGGGSQSVAFALLGARVTVLDLSEAQLARDAEAAAHYGFRVEMVQGDIRDLSRFAPDSFDIVFHAYSLNFVPDARKVFREVARVVRPKGIYKFNCANPFLAGMGTKDWNGEGYLLRLPYVDGAEVIYEDEEWVYKPEAAREIIEGPKEFRQTFRTLMNGLAENGFVIFAASEETEHEPDAEPGSWDHFKSVAPPWLTFWTTYRPDVFEGITTPH
jgi:ubiquinone/menaquinone biosynthesis C-methylase UbiE